MLVAGPEAVLPGTQVNFAMHKSTKQRVTLSNGEYKR